MSPLVSVVNTALLRAAELIERGKQPAKALRQVAVELEAYADMNAQKPIPPRSFDHLLGDRRESRM